MPDVYSELRLTMKELRETSDCRDVQTLVGTCVRTPLNTTLIGPEGGASSKVNALRLKELQKIPG